MTPIAQRRSMSEVETEFLFEARIPLAPPLHVGQTPDVLRHRQANLIA